MRGNPDTAQNRVQPVLNAVASLQRSAPRFTVAEFGDASSSLQEQSTINSGLHKAEILSLPITFLILLIAFGAVVAAGVPVLLGLLRGDGRRRLGVDREPPRARLRCDELGDAADGHGRRGRLLALLPQARARGAAGRPHAS